MDLIAVRTFVAVVDAGQFLEAATTLLVSQQAVSKRIAALETSLDTSLLIRNSRGITLTSEGEKFLPHARHLLKVAEEAVASVGTARTALRIDIVNSQIGPARLVREFHQAHPSFQIEILTHYRDAESALSAVRAGELDVTFRAISDPERQLTGKLSAFRVFDDPVELLVSTNNPLCAHSEIVIKELKHRQIWMPNLVNGSEWEYFYKELSRAFEVSINTKGPNFGANAMLEAIAASDEQVTFVGAGIEFGGLENRDFRRIPIREPNLVYPHSVVFRSNDSHPTLVALKTFLTRTKERYLHKDAWFPTHWLHS